MNEVACDFGCDEQVGTVVFLRGAVRHNKAAHGLPDPYQGLAEKLI